MTGPTITGWMYLHPWMTFFVLLAVADGVPYLFGKRQGNG